MYKFPANGVNYTQVKRGFNTNGLQFAYFDANTKNLSYWNMSSETLYSQENPLAFTLAKLFAKKKSSNIAYVTYNDQPFTGEEEPAKEPHGHRDKEYAHSKGILMADLSSGMWLVHSTPQFPVNVHMGEFNMTRTARKNGQYFMCLTVPATEVDEIDNLISFRQMKARARYVQTKAKRERWQGNVSTINSSTSPKKVWYRIHKINGSYHAFKIPLLSRNGTCPDTLEEQADIFGERFEYIYPPSITHSLKYNAKMLDMLLNSSRENNHVIHVCHGKFVLRVSFICFSSLNVASTQFQRGGELLCRDNETVAGLFRRTVAKVEACDATDPSGNPRPPTAPGHTTTTKKPWRWTTTTKRPSGKWPTRAPGNKPTKPAKTKRTKKPTKPEITRATRKPTTKKTKQTKKPKLQNVQKTKKTKTR
ncbi:unnamed protein product [Ixodes persulcatus]